MNEITTQRLRFSPAELQVIRRSVAPDTNDTEFDLFIAACRMYGLNPIRREIFAAVYDKDKADKRQMAIIVEMAGRRVLASRCGNYRPASEPTEFFYREELVGPTNPLGIEKAVVKLWQQDNQGTWWPVVGEAYWDEHAKTTDEWAGPYGQRKKTGQKILTKTWREMPRLMIAKVAEGQALRKGWPEVFGGIYSDAEAPAGSVFDDDRTATDLVEQKEVEQRNDLIGRVKDEYPLQFDMGGPIEMVASGSVFDRVGEWARNVETEMEVRQFRSVNSDSLKRFWADHKADALELNQMLESLVKNIVAKAENSAAGSDSGGEAPQTAETQAAPSQGLLIS